MLANLLPGVREIRAPLAAGYAWLLLVWLTWGHEMADRPEGELMAQMDRLEPLVRGFGLTVVVSVAAYLLGSLAIASGDGMIEGVRRLRRGPDDREAGDHRTRAGRFSQSSSAALLAWAEDALQRRTESVAEETDGELPVAADQWSSRSAPMLANRVAIEFELVKTQLLATKPELYSEVDRKDSEALFRLALVPPLGALLAWLTFADSPLWLIGVVPVLGLFLQGRALQRSAGDTLVVALRAQPDFAPPALLTQVRQFRIFIRSASQLEHESQLNQSADEVGAAAVYKNASGTKAWETASDADRLLAEYERALRLSPEDPHAALDLGTLMAEQGDLDQARALLRRAVESGQEDAAPRAAVTLGALMADQGGYAEARALLRQAIASGHQDAAPRAALTLGALMVDEGDFAESRALLRRAIESGHQDAAPIAAVNLAAVMANQGDLDEARALLRQAIASGHEDAAPRAALNLGALLTRDGEIGEALDVYEQALAISPDGQMAAMALVNLGGLHARMGRLEEAFEALTRAAEMGDPAVAARALLARGRVAAMLGRIADARADYERAASSVEADVASSAALSLGELLAERGDIDHARAAYERAAKSSDPDARSAALGRLSALDMSASPSDS